MVPFPNLAPVLALLLVGSLWVHTELRESIPGDGDLLTEPVTEVTLRFSTEVQLPLSRIQLLGPGDRPVPTGDLYHPQDDETRLRVSLVEPLPRGRYTVEWRAGAPDNHIISGSYPFQVQGGEPDQEGERPEEPRQPDPSPVAELEPEGTPRAATAEPILPPGTGSRWLYLLAMVLTLGVAAFRVGVLRSLQGRGEMARTVEELAPRLRRLGWTAAALLVIVLPLRLWDQVGGEGLELAGTVLFRTAWGAGWFVQLIVAILALVGLVLMRGSEDRARGWEIFVGAAVLLPLVPAVSGHAWAADPRFLAVGAVYLHVAAVGVWLGGLLILLLAGLPALRKAEGRSAPVGEGVLPPLARMVNTFSRVALGAVAILVISGSLSAFLQLGGLGALLTSPYGQVLGIKVALVGFAFLLGFYNWRKVRPSLAEKPDPGELRIPASLEAVLGLLVLLVTAVLVVTPTP